MSITFSTPPARTATDGQAAPQQPAPAPTPSAEVPVATAGRRWPLFGAAGAVTGFLAVVAAMPSLEEEDYSAGPEVIRKLEAGGYRIAFVFGLLTIGLLLTAGAGWRRWAEARAPRDLAARIVGQGLIATATVNIAFYGFTGAMGLYLDGGVEAETGLNDQGLYVLHSVLDFGSLLGWWATAVSAVAVAALAFRKARLLPRWMGVVSVLLLLPPVLLALGTSLPGFVGFTMPIWLLAISIGMAVSKVARADA